MAKKKHYKHPCKLLPYKMIPVVSIQDAAQKAGWNITAFKLPQTWQFTQGEGVKIAVVDTGCDLDHPDLVDNLLPGYNFVNPGAPPEDDNNHGTHCTGIICAENNDIGVVGVAPKAKVMPVKVIDSTGEGDMDILAKGIRWATDNGADIITMSVGSPQPLSNVRKAIKYAASKGIPVFVAAGNAGFTNDVFYPAAYPETIAVGSIDENFDRSSFSNTGKNLDFLAPGGKILSTIPNNWYGVLSGTSMACPFAVGVAALVLSYKRQNKLTFPLGTVEDYRNMLKEKVISCKNPEFAGNRFFEGFGIIDPFDLVEWIAANEH